MWRHDLNSAKEEKAVIARWLTPPLGSTELLGLWFLGKRGQRGKGKGKGPGLLLVVKVFHGDVDILFLSKDTCVYSPPLKYLIAHVKSDKGIGRSLCKILAFVLL